MFMKWNIHYCLIVSAPQIDLYILYNHSQNPRKIFFCEKQQTVPKMCKEMQRATNNQDNLKEKQN